MNIVARSQLLNQARARSRESTDQLEHLSPEFAVVARRPEEKVIIVKFEPSGGELPFGKLSRLAAQHESALIITGQTNLSGLIVEPGQSAGDVKAAFLVMRAGLDAGTNPSLDQTLDRFEARRRHREHAPSDWGHTAPGARAAAGLGWDVKDRGSKIEWARLLDDTAQAREHFMSGSPPPEISGFPGFYLMAGQAQPKVWVVDTVAQGKIPYAELAAIATRHDAVVVMAEMTDLSGLVVRPGDDAASVKASREAAPQRSRPLVEALDELERLMA